VPLSHAFQSFRPIKGGGEHCITERVAGARSGTAPGGLWGWADLSRDSPLPLWQRTRLRTDGLDQQTCWEIHPCPGGRELVCGLTGWIGRLVERFTPALVAENSSADWRAVSADLSRDSPLPWW